MNAPGISITDRLRARLCAVLLPALLVAAPAAGQGFGTNLAHAILLDYGTGTVLYQRNADAEMPPASMAKLMTMLVLFEALRDGRYTLDDRFVVSEHAWRTGGAPSRTSTMFASAGSSIAIRDLMRGVIVQSGNDAAIAVAEGMAGSEEAFAVLMNDAAARIGLRNSVFTNPTGLPDPAQHVTARDLATLAAHIIREFPEYYAIYSEREFTWNGITQPNRNPLLGMNIGADGMKTGFTEQSGYGMIASAERDGRRLIAVINGAASEDERSREAAALLEWGFGAFTTVSLFGEGGVIAEAAVYGGAEPTVGLRLDAPLEILLSAEAVTRIAAEIVYEGPLEAPVAAGAAVGVLRILLDGAEVATAPVLTARSVAAGTLPQRARDAVIDLFFGWQ